MNNGLVIRLLRVATYLHDIGENGYEVETIKEAAVRIEAFLEGAQVADNRIEHLQKLLEMRDVFIVKHGLWHEFVNSLELKND